MNKYITANHHPDISFILWLMNDQMFCAWPIVWVKILFESTVELVTTVALQVSQIIHNSHNTMLDILKILLYIKNMRQIGKGQERQAGQQLLQRKDLCFLLCVVGFFPLCLFVLYQLEVNSSDGWFCLFFFLTSY